MTKLLSITTLLLASASVFAQDMKSPKEVTDLAWMIGTWSGEGKMSFGGQEAPVKTTMVVTFDGQFVKAVSTTEEGGMTMRETMMLGWNEDTKMYDSYTFTSFAPTPGIKHGKIEDGKLVLVSEPWKVQGMSFVSRATYAKVSDSKLRMGMDFKSATGWDTALDMQLSKK